MSVRVVIACDRDGDPKATEYHPNGTDVSARDAQLAVLRSTGGGTYDTLTIYAAGEWSSATVE